MNRPCETRGQTRGERVGTRPKSIAYEQPRAVQGELERKTTKEMQMASTVIEMPIRPPPPRMPGMPIAGHDHGDPFWSQEFLDDLEIRLGIRNVFDDRKG